MKMDATEACTICQNCGQPSNWTHDDGGCPRCSKPRGTPPIAAPAAHVERRKGQVEVGQLWRAGSKQHRVTSVDGEYVTTDVVGGDARFHGPTMLTYWTLLSDATPEPTKSCESVRELLAKHCDCGRHPERSIMCSACRVLYDLNARRGKAGI